MSSGSSSDTEDYLEQVMFRTSVKSESSRRAGTGSRGCGKAAEVAVEAANISVAVEAAIQRLQ